MACIITFDRILSGGGEFCTPFIVIGMISCVSSFSRSSSSLASRIAWSLRIYVREREQAEL